MSTDDQARGESPEHHEMRARGYASAKDWRVIELYDLSGVSGKSILEHPETKRMLTDIRSGRISALIFSKLARLARNTRELLDIADIFREHGAGLISLQESIDTTTPAGRLFYTMIAAMAQWEREEISERVAASVPIRAKLGKPTGGAAPYGYRWEKNELLLDANEAPIRRLMFELFLEHRRKKTVARELNEKGHRTRRGANFSDTTVDRLLRDPIAKGLRRANYTKSRGEKKHWDLKPEDEWVYSKVEPIVSEEVWDEVNRILDTQRSSRKRVARKPAVHLFSGLTRCECGEPMYVPSNSPKYTCRKCRTKIPTEDLEAIYREQLQNFLLSEEELNGYLNQAHDVIADKIEILAVLEKEHSDLQSQVDKFYDLYMSDNISKEGFGRKFGPLDERIKQLDEEIPRVQSEIDFLKIQNLSSEAAFSETQSLAERWDTLSKNEQLGIIEAVTESIVIGKEEVSINLHYLPFLKSGNIATHQQGFIAAMS
ncbi:MAG: recombinase family protein [Pseudomonadota bacterium]